MGVWAPVDYTFLHSCCSETALIFVSYPALLFSSIYGHPHVFDSFTFIPSVLAHIRCDQNILRFSYVNAVNKHPLLLPNVLLNLLALLKGALWQRDVQT